jgi:hypothetical protein
MTGIYSLTHLSRETISDSLKNGFRTLGNWVGRALTLIQNVPHQMQANPTVAIAVFAGSNVLFYKFVANPFANGLGRLIDERAIERYPSELPPHIAADYPSFKNLLLNGVIVGGSVLSFNLILSRLADYPLSKTALAAITTAAIAARYLSSYAAAAK